jgi:acetyltransferase
MGPKGIGVISPRCRLNASFCNLNPLPGETAFIGQCPMVGLAFADWAAHRRVGLSHLITLGDTFDVDLADVLEYLGEDPATKVILLHIERFPSGARFLSAARAAARRKVVIAMKSGRVPELQDPSIKVPPGLHDADAVHEAVLRRAGVLRIERTDELVDAMAALARFRGVAGERLAIISNGAGPGTLATDALLRSGGTLARLSRETMQRLRELLPSAWNGRNPIDLFPDATPRRYQRAIELITQDAALDALLVILVPTVIAPPLDVAQAVIAAGASARHPVCACWMGESTIGEARDLSTTLACRASIRLSRLSRHSCRSSATRARRPRYSRLLASRPRPRLRRARCRNCFAAI